MGCLWGCTDYPLGMFAARGSNSWIYDTSHLRYVRYVWSCIFLLFNKSAWAANTWIGGHFWAFTSGMSNYYAKCLFTILFNLQLTKLFNVRYKISTCKFNSSSIFFWQWWHVLIFFALLFWHQTGLKFALFRLKHGCIADGQINSDIIQEDDLNELAISFWPI